MRQVELASAKDTFTKPGESQQTSIRVNADESFSTNHLVASHERDLQWINPASRFSEPVAIKSGNAAIQCSPLNGNLDSQPELLDGKTLIFRNAFPGCDVKYKSSTFKTEEFIVVKDSSALDENGKTAWTWELNSQFEGQELKSQLTSIHTINLVDSQGAPRLRIDAPYGTDASGAAILAGKHIKFTVDGTRLTMSLDSTGLQITAEN